MWALSEQYSRLAWWIVLLWNIKSCCNWEICNHDLRPPIMIKWSYRDGQHQTCHHRNVRERGLEFSYVHKILRHIILGEDWRCDIWGGGVGGSGVEYCAAVTRLWLTSISISPPRSYQITSLQSTEGLRTGRISHRMFLTEGLQDILPSNHHSQESQGMSSLVFKINVLIILMAVILFVLFSLFVICGIM